MNGLPNPSLLRCCIQPRLNDPPRFVRAGMHMHVEGIDRDDCCGRRGRGAPQRRVTLRSVGLIFLTTEVIQGPLLSGVVNNVALPRFQKGDIKIY